MTINAEECRCPVCGDKLTILEAKILYGEQNNKKTEAVKPVLDFDGKDVWRCGNCGGTIFHPNNTQADEDEKNYNRYCRKCGREVKWNDESGSD